MGEEIRRLRAEGLTYNEIARRLGCAKSTIAYHIGPGQREAAIARANKKTSHWKLYVAEHKVKAGCKDCGEHYPAFMLDLDHLPGTDKRFCVSFSRSFASLDEVKAEIDKCEVVCANCHRLRTWNRALKG